MAIKVSDFDSATVDVAKKLSKKRANFLLLKGSFTAKITFSVLEGQKMANFLAVVWTRSIFDRGITLSTRSSQSS